MKIKIISGNLSKINSTLELYGHDYNYEKDCLVVDEEGCKCLEVILDIKYDIIEGSNPTAQDIYRIGLDKE